MQTPHRKAPSGIQTWNSLAVKQQHYPAHFRAAQFQNLSVNLFNLPPNAYSGWRVFYKELSPHLLVSKAHTTEKSHLLYLRIRALNVHRLLATWKRHCTNVNVWVFLNFYSALKINANCYQVKYLIMLPLSPGTSRH